MATLLRDTTGMKTKTCGKCGEAKPLDAFGKRASAKDGLLSWCRECANAHNRNKRATDPVYAQRNRDLCAARYRGEKLEPIGNARTADERFDDKLVPEPNTGCLIWTGSVGSHGYGDFRDGEHSLAHRWAYERAYGPIPEGHEVHHECFTPLCCEPSHLRALTPEEHAALHKEVD